MNFPALPTLGLLIVSTKHLLGAEAVGPNEMQSAPEIRNKEGCCSPQPLMHTQVFGEVNKDSRAEAGFGVGWEMLRLSPTSSAITCPPCV